MRFSLRQAALATTAPAARRSPVSTPNPWRAPRFPAACPRAVSARRLRESGAARRVKEYLPFIVVGLASGSVYALAAMGLVVTYKTSGIFNFAHGAVGMISTFVFYSLRHDAGLPAAVAIAIVVLG